MKVASALLLVASLTQLHREFKWLISRVRFYEDSYELVAYDQRDRPSLIREARDSQAEIDSLLERLKDPEKAPPSDKRLRILLEAIIRERPKLFLGTAPGFLKAYEIEVLEDIVSMRALNGVPTWEDLGHP